MDNPLSRPYSQERFDPRAVVTEYKTKPYNLAKFRNVLGFIPAFADYDPMRYIVDAIINLGAVATFVIDPQYGPRPLNTEGWTLLNSCGGKVDLVSTQGGGLHAVACLTGQAVNAATDPIIASRMSFWEFTHLVGGNPNEPRYRLTEYFERPLGSGPYTPISTSVPPTFSPVRYPTTDRTGDSSDGWEPYTYPPGVNKKVMGGNPARPGYRDNNNDWSSNNSRYSRDGASSSRRANGFGLDTLGVGSGNGVLGPDAGTLTPPADDLPLGPGITVAPRKPPGPREIERKVAVMASTPRWLMRLFGASMAATEYKDAVDILYDALPAAVKRSARRDAAVLGDGWRPGVRYVSVVEKSRMLKKYWDKVDWNKAIPALVANHFTDEVIGRISGKSQEFLNRQNVFGFGHAT